MGLSAPTPPGPAQDALLPVALPVARNAAAVAAGGAEAAQGPMPLTPPVRGTAYSDERYNGATRLAPQVQGAADNNEQHKVPPHMAPHEQGTVFSDEQQGSTFLAPAPRLFAKGAPTPLAAPHPEHSPRPAASDCWTASMDASRAISNPSRDSSREPTIRVTPRAFCSKGATGTTTAPRAAVHAYSFSEAHDAAASQRLAFGPHARSAAGTHNTIAGKGASPQLHPQRSTSAAEAGLAQAGLASAGPAPPKLPFAWQDSPHSGLEIQGDQGLPVGEANEQSCQQDDGHAAAQDAVYQQSLDFQEHSLMSMVLPSDATHKRYAFIFGDSVKVRMLSWLLQGSFPTVVQALQAGHPREDAQPYLVTLP
eukprot:scaffold234171_cov22-Tisochrysis_lutea.AAC.1